MCDLIIVELEKKQSHNRDCFCIKCEDKKVNTYRAKH